MKPILLRPQNGRVVLKSHENEPTLNRVNYLSILPLVAGSDPQWLGKYQQRVKTAIQFLLIHSLPNLK